MSELPEDQVTEQDIIAWYEADAALTKAKNHEMLLRQRVFKGLFTAPVEGTNSLNLKDGYVLKATYKLNRSVDLEAVQTLADDLREAGVDAAQVIRYKPELETKAYKSLNLDQKKVFDQCLVIKPGTPSLEIVLPKRASKSVHLDIIPE